MQLHLMKAGSDERCYTKNEKQFSKRKVFHQISWRFAPWWPGLWCAVCDNTTPAWSGSSFCRTKQKKIIQEVYMNRRRRRHQPGTPKRAAVYARSSKLWPLGETGALEAKVGQSATYCLEHDYFVPHDKRLASVQAGSAGSDRPALVRLLEAIRHGSVAVVVVRSLDRLARDPAQSAIPIEEFRATGVSITTTGS